ncbi:hypothetical protein ACET3Z_015821 [Daucus carota]
MSIVYSSLFSPSFIALPFTKPIAKLNSLHPYSPPTIRWNNPRRDFQLPSVASIPYPPINVDYLETEFNGHGVSFASIGDGCVVKMKLDNGSLASIMLPSGLITSYKAPMWHEGLLELLHTVVSEAEDGGGVIQGGVSLAFKCESQEGVSWSPSNWALYSVTGSPEEFIQVELISSNRERMVEIKHIVTLRQDVLSSELIITNSNITGIRLMGSIVSHLAVSTPEATYAMGLERSNFFIRPPVLSNYSIVPPDFGKTKKTASGIWKIFSGWGSKNLEIANDADKMSYESREELEGEEDDNNKQLTEEMSRIYTCAPTNFTVLDRGRRNSVVVAREGFNELYIFSPGSNHNSYSKYAYICLGQAALLEPISLPPGSEWRAAQHLHNPNM